MLRSPQQNPGWLRGLGEILEKRRRPPSQCLPISPLCEHAEGFSIDVHELDQTQWAEGFVTVPREDVAAKLDERSDLTELFRVLGAPHPEGWAASQVEEGIPQLHRFLFLRQAWKAIYSENSTSWTDAAIMNAQRRPDAPYAGMGTALATLRTKCISDDEIADLVRDAQAELLFQLCYLLEDPDLTEEGATDVGWGLFTVSEDGTPGEPIVGLHESVLDTDPTGREMRPRRIWVCWKGR